MRRGCDGRSVAHAVQEVTVDFDGAVNHADVSGGFEHNGATPSLELNDGCPSTQRMIEGYESGRSERCLSRLAERFSLSVLVGDLPAGCCGFLSGMECSFRVVVRSSWCGGAFSESRQNWSHTANNVPLTRRCRGGRRGGGAGRPASVHREVRFESRRRSNRATIGSSSPDPGPTSTPGRRHRERARGDRPGGRSTPAGSS